MLVVIARPPREQLRATGECRLVGDRVRADVDVAVEDPALDAERRRDDEEAGARLVEGHHGVLEHERVEGVEGLRGMQPVLEPEPALLECSPVLAEDDVVGVHLLPPRALGRNRHLERAGEACAPRARVIGDAHRPVSFRRPSIVGPSPAPYNPSRLHAGGEGSGPLPSMPRTTDAPPRPPRAARTSGFMIGFGVLPCLRAHRGEHVRQGWPPRRFGAGIRDMIADAGDIAGCQGHDHRTTRPFCARSRALDVRSPGMGRGSSDGRVR